MKVIIVYYTFGGETRKEAKRLAAELGVGTTLYEVREKKERSVLGSLFKGCYQAMRRKSSDIRTVSVNLGDYDRIIIGAPIWAEHPAPAFNAIVDHLPAGKEVELYFCSGSSGSETSKQGTIEMIEKKGCKVVSYRDVLTGKGLVKEKRTF
ncbi:MAG: flavodoxin family protein [Eubacteriales bacterium]|nr:hypothetical protein [Clostridiales bacterium]